jgi:hypothetical protein
MMEKVKSAENSFCWRKVCEVMGNNQKGKKLQERKVDYLVS